jgi:hypothetical protein
MHKQFVRNRFVGLCRFFGVHLINRTNLIMVAVEGKCQRLRKKTSIVGKEVIYPLDEELENATLVNDVIAQICRVPYIHLDRKKPTVPCLYFNEEVIKKRRPLIIRMHGALSALLPTIFMVYFLLQERYLREECGTGSHLKSSLIVTLLSIVVSLIHRHLRIL